MPDTESSYIGKSIAVEVTRDCNLSCTYCSIRGIQGRHLNSENFDTILQFAERNESRWITLSGTGEPTLNPFFGDFLLRVAAAGLNAAVLTNGTLIERLQETLKLTSQARQYWIVNLEGVSPAVVSKMSPGKDLNAVIRGFLALCTAKSVAREIELQIIVSSLNEAEVPELISLGRKLGVDHIGLKALNLDGMPPKKRLKLLPRGPHAEFDRYGSREQPCRCGVIGRSLYVGRDLRVYVCPKFLYGARHAIAMLEGSGLKCFPKAEEIITIARDRQFPDCHGCSVELQETLRQSVLREDYLPRTKLTNEVYFQQQFYA